MAVPKQKTSRSKRNSRRAHDGISKVSISFDSVTGEPKLPHHLSLKDGYYNGKQMVKPKGKNKEADNSHPGSKEPKVTKEKTKQIKTDKKSEFPSETKDK
jgi:large subunit ribosomal protein L32